MLMMYTSKARMSALHNTNISRASEATVLRFQVPTHETLRALDPNMSSFKESGIPYCHIRVPKTKDRHRKESTILTYNKGEAIHGILEANPKVDDMKLSIETELDK